VTRLFAGIGRAAALGFSALAQNPNDYMRLFGEMRDDAIVQATRAEWRRLPTAEYSCVDETLRARNSNIEGLAQRGITPADPRIANIRASCHRSAFSPPPTPAPQNPNGPTQTNVEPNPYEVDHLALGGHVGFGSPEYAAFQCKPSDQFGGFQWCQRERQEAERRGPFRSRTTIMHGQDGTAVYINRFIEPAFWDRNEVQDDLARRERKFGEKARIISDLLT
jgi:hypothetical protein